VLAAVVHLAMGLALGALTSLPLGVANVAVVEAGLSAGRRRALWVAAGGATADTAHASLAFVGIGSVAARYHAATGTFFVVSGAVVAAYGVLAVHRGGGPGAAAAPARSDPRAYATGLVLTLFNPAALLAWVAVAGALPPAGVVSAVATGVGVGLGAFTVFAALAVLAVRGRDLLGRGRARVTRLAGMALIVLGAVSAARGLLSLLW